MDLKVQDDIYSQYLRQLTMHPLQLKKHESEMQSKQIIT